MEKKKICKITFLVTLVILLASVIGGFLLKNSTWFFNPNKNALKTMSSSIIKTQDGEFALDGTEIIEKATELLGKPYAYDNKGYNGAYYNGNYDQNKLYAANQIGNTTNGATNDNGIDCSGLVYWSISSLAKEKGWSTPLTSGFSFNSPIPANTDNWLQYYSNGYGHYWKEVYSYTYNTDTNVWEKESSSDGGSTSIYDANLTFKGKSINVLKINDFISDDLRYYEYYDESGNKKVLPSGTIIASYGKGIGSAYNHTWIYIGDLGTTDTKKVKEILDSMLGTNINESYIVSKGPSTHWRIESTGDAGVTINNGDPDFGAVQYDVSSNGSLKAKGVGPIWAFQIANDDVVEGTYHVNVAKKSLNNNSSIDANIDLVSGVTFELTQQIDESEQVNTAQKTTTGNGKDKVVFSGTGNDSNGEVTISKTGVVEGKPDVYKITETTVPEKYEEINDLLQNISIQVYKKQDGKTLKIDYVRVNDVNGSQIGNTSSSGQGSNIETGYDLDSDGNYDVGIVVNNEGTAFTIIVRNPEVTQEGQYKLSIAKKSRDKATTVEEGTASFKISQILNSNNSSEITETVNVNSVPVVSEDSTEKTAIQFNGNNEIEINSIGIDTYKIRESAVSGNYYIGESWTITLDVHKIEKEETVDNVTTKKYDIDYITVSNKTSVSYKYNVGLDKGENRTTQSGETIYNGAIRINSNGEIVTEETAEYVAEINVKDADNDGIIEIDIVWTNPKKISYSLSLVKKAMKTTDFTLGDKDDAYILGDTTENNGTNKSWINANTGDLIQGAVYGVSQYQGISLGNIQTFANSFYNSANPAEGAYAYTEVTTSEELQTAFSNISTTQTSAQHIFVIQELTAAEGYQLNKNVFFIVVNFEKQDDSTLVIRGVVVYCGLLNNDGTITIQNIENEDILTGENYADGSDWNASTSANTKYRIDYSDNAIVFTAPDAPIEGSYDFSLVKKSQIPSNSIEKIEDAIQNSIPGAKYKVKQYLNIAENYTEEYLDEIQPNNEIIVTTNEYGTLIDENGNTLNEVFSNVKITNTNTVDIYVIQEIESPAEYIQDSYTYYAIVRKAIAQDSETGLKSYVIGIEEGDEESLYSKDQEPSAVELFFYTIDPIHNLRYFNGNNMTGGSQFIGSTNNARIDFSTNTIIFSHLNTKKTGKYNFQVIKTNSENGKIIKDELAKFDVNVYTEKTVNADGTVIYSNKKQLINSDGEVIQTTDLYTENGIIRGIENIVISDEDIGKTYYFVIEEKVAPTQYNKIQYQVVVPVTYYNFAEKYGMSKGEAIALTETTKTISSETVDGVTIEQVVSVTGKEKEFSDISTQENEIVTTEQSVLNIITVKVPNTPWERYNVPMELNKLGSIEKESIAGAQFKVTDITTDSEMKIGVYNKLNGENVELLEDGSFVVPVEGILLDFSDLIANKEYQILIEEIQAPDEYNATLKSVTLQISIDENEVITTQILKAVDINGNEVDATSQNSVYLEGTNQDGKVQIEVNEPLENATIQYKLGEDGEWQNYTQDVQVQENTTLYAKTIIDGVESDISFKVIDNIDKVAPTLESYTENDTGDIETSINIVLADTATGNFGASGIVKYGLSTSDETEPTSYVTTNQETTVEATINQISANGIYYIWIWDEAGNCGIEEVEITTVHDDIFVAEITAASAGYEHLIGTQYRTLEAAIKACPELANGTATVSLIHEIYNESNIVGIEKVIEDGNEVEKKVDKNVTIDLNGYTLTSRGNTATLSVAENSTLTLINTKTTGSVVNQNTQAILVDEGGTFILGVSNEEVAVSQPTVTGLGVGIRNNGTFNFYDGNVNAIADVNSNASAIYGTVTDWPMLYSVSVADYTEPEQKQTATLAIISNIEARIGRKTYTKLEDAVADAGTQFGTDGSQVEIVIVADLAKDSTVVIDETKNIKLDLDGHTYTTSSSGYIIDNNGKLEIVDSSEEQTGTIYATTSHAIRNNGTSETGEIVKTIDLSEVKLANGAEYGFEYNLLTQQLVSTNKTNFTQSDSYVEIDLTDKQGLYTLVVNAEVSTRASYNSAYINVTNSPDLSTSLKGELVCTISGEIAAADYKLNLIGGHKYYMHMVYDRGRYVYGSDTFTINSVNVVNRGELPELTLTSGTIDVQLNSSNSSQFTGGIVNLGEFTMNGGTLTSSTSGIYKTGIINSAGGISTVNAGTFSGNIAGVENISTFGQGIGSVTINNATMSAGSDAIRALSANGFVTINDGTFSSNYKVVANYNNNKVTINGGNYACTGTAFRDYNFEYTNTVIGIYNSNKAEVHITDGTFSGATVIYAYGSNKVTIDGGTFSGTRPIYTYGTSNYAELEINGGTISTGSYYTIYNSNNVKMKITGGTIENTSTNSSYHAIYTDGNNPNIEITGGTIKAVGGRTINMETDGTLNIQGGDISSSTNVGVCTGGTLTSVTLGTKDGIVNTESPKIKGTMGIDAPWADVYFYDGQIISNKGTTLTVGIVDIETGKQVITESGDDTLDRVILGEEADVAQIGETKYKSIQAAIDAVEETEEQTTIITLLKSIYQTETVGDIEGKNIQLNLNSQTITVINKDGGIVNDGILEITDLSDSKTGLIVGNTAVNLIQNNSTLTINNGTYYSRYGGRDANNYRSIVKNNGNVTINNATIKGTENYYHAIEGGNITIQGGNIDVRGTGKIYGIYTNGIVNVTGASIYVAAATYSGGSGFYESYGIYIYDEAKVICSNTTFTTYAYYGNHAIYNASSNKESVIEGITHTTGDYSVYNNGTGTITVKSGTMNQIRNYSSGNIEVYGGTIGLVANYSEGTINVKEETEGMNIVITGQVYNNGTGTINLYNSEVIGTDRQLVYNGSSGTINIDGTTINTTWDYAGSSYGAIVNNSTGDVNIINATINSACYAISNISTGKIVIGTQGGDVSKELPLISSSSSYGLYNESTGEIYFYDGIIKGRTSSIYGTITAVEDGYEIIKTTDENSIESAVLDKLPVAKIGETPYYTIQEAVEACEDSVETEIDILRNITLTSDIESVTINDTKNIILDLNRYQINSATDNTFVNNGQFKIIDSSETQTGAITNSVGSIIENTNILNITGGEYTVTTNGTETQYIEIIKNTGNVNITNAKIVGTGNFYRAIEGGNITLDTVTINLNGDYMLYGVYTDELVTVSNSTINTYAYDWVHGTTSLQKAYGIYIYGENGKVICNNSTFNTKGSSNYAVYTESSNTESVVEGITHSSGLFTVYNNGTGKITVNSGTLIYYIVNNKDGIIDINGGTITRANNIGTGTLNIYEGTNVTEKLYSETSTGIINIYGGEIKYIDISNGTVNLLGGTVNGGLSENAIYLDSDTSILNIGANDGTVNLVPTIVGYISYGTYYDINPVINYYDGIITTSTSYYGFESFVTSIPDSYEIIQNINSEGNREISLSNNTYVAQVGDEQFTSLEAAIAACSDTNNTIVLIKDVIIFREVNIENTKNVILNLNGNDIYAVNKDIGINNAGTLEITDMSTEQSSEVSRYSNTIIKNTGNLTIDGGYYTVKNKYNTSKVIYNTEEGNVNWKNGSVYFAASTYKANQCAIYSDGTGNINVDNAEFNTYGIYSSGDVSLQYFIDVNNANETKNTVTINGGTYKTSNSNGRKGVVNVNTKNSIINILGGTVTDVYTVYSGSTPETNISGGSHYEIVSKGITTILGGEIENIGGSAARGGTLIVEDGTIGTINNYEGTVNINGGTVGRIFSTIYYTSSPVPKTTINGGIIGNIESRYGSVEILGGTINNTDTTYDYAIYNWNQSTLTIGTKDETVDKTIPTVTSATAYGVKNEATFNFYDGIIQGTTQAILGEVTDMPESYKVVTESNDTIAYLDIVSETENIVSVNGIYYTSLESAVTAAAQTSGTILLAKDFELTNSITVPETATITINLNAHNITGALSDALIINNGNLTIVDEAETVGEGETVQAKIENTSGAAIQNDGTLTIGVNDGTVDTVTPNIIGTPNAIINNGTLHTYDGLINGVAVTVGTVESVYKTQTIAQLSENQTSIYKLANAERLNADNTVQTLSTQSSESVIAPTISVDKELPEWTNQYVTATLTTQKRFVLNIENIEKNLYKININKVDENGEGLDGVTFETKSIDETGAELENTTAVINTPLTTTTTSSLLEVVLNKISEENVGITDIYEITETATKTGYFKLVDPIKVTVVKEKVEIDSEVSYKVSNFMINDIEPTNGTITTEVSLEGTDDKNATITATIAENIITITAENEMETVERVVEKVWDDNNNEYGLRPESIEVTLFKETSDGNVIFEKEGISNPVELTETNNWSYTWNELPKYDDGVEVKYVIEETEEIAEYTISTEVEDNTTIITNTATPEPTQRTIQKVWTGLQGESADNFRATFKLYKYSNGTKVEVLDGNGEEITRTIQGNNTATFDNLVKYENGELIEYVVEETLIQTTSDNGVTWKEVSKDNVIITANSAQTLANTVNVGDYVDYDASSGESVYTYTTDSNLTGNSSGQVFSSSDSMKWRVLSVDKENKVVQLIAADGAPNTISLSGVAGYRYGVKVLDDISAVYGHGKGATTARSVKIQDIELYSTYDKTTANGALYEYGATESYTSGTYYLDDGTEIIASTDNPVTMTQSFYSYGLSGSYEDTDKFKLMCYGSDGTTYLNYYIATKANSLGPNACGMYFYGMNNGNQQPSMLYTADGSTSTYMSNVYVRPVVTLEADLLTSGKDSNGTWVINYARADSSEIVLLENETTIITNEITRIETDRTVQKVWNMPENEVNNYRATLTLYKIVDGEKIAVLDNEGNEISEIIRGNGTAQFENLLKYENGVLITYCVEETLVEKYIGKDEITGEEIWDDVTDIFAVKYKE